VSDVSDEAVASAATPAGEDAQAVQKPYESRMFFVIGIYTTIIAIAFIVLDGEATGSTLLAFAALFSLVTAAYLHHRNRAGGIELEEPEGADGGAVPGAEIGAEEPWFPERSLWPLTIAGGTALVVGGLALGLWILIPGCFLLARGLWGFTVQSRIRSD
jgi:hypothetical protein